VDSDSPEPDFSTARSMSLRIMAQTSLWIQELQSLRCNFLTQNLQEDPQNR